MEKDFKLKLVKLRELLERGDVVKISLKIGVSRATIYQMLRLISSKT